MVEAAPIVAARDLIAYKLDGPVSALQRPAAIVLKDAVVPSTSSLGLTAPPALRVLVYPATTLPFAVITKGEPSGLEESSTTSALPDPA